MISRGMRRVRASVLARIKNDDGGEDVDEIMDDEEGDADADAVEEGAQNGVGVNTNVVMTEPTNAVSATDRGGDD